MFDLTYYNELSHLISLDNWATQQLDNNYSRRATHDRIFNQHEIRSRFLELDTLCVKHEDWYKWYLPQTDFNLDRIPFIVQSNGEFNSNQSFAVNRRYSRQ